MNRIIILLMVVVGLSFSNSINPDVQERLNKLKEVSEVFKGQDYAKAFEMTNDETIRDVPIVQYLRGLMYFNGDGINKNIYKAIDLWEKASLKGQKDAMKRLGFVYYLGIGSEPNYIKAKELFEESAKKGDAESAYILALMYFDGDIIEKNEEKGMKWLEESANLGNEEARDLLIDKICGETRCFPKEQGSDQLPLRKPENPFSQGQNNSSVNFKTDGSAGNIDEPTKGITETLIESNFVQINSFIDTLLRFFDVKLKYSILLHSS